MGKKYKMICANDNEKEFNFEKAKLEINAAFQKILPKKSSFER
jgi:hypothetical protein